MNILIVDDDTLIRNWLSILLTQLKSYEINILEATDGIEALEVCATSPIDLVITDIKMPRLNGIDLITRLKADYPHIRTSVLSSYDDFDYVRVALKCGALDYILKAEMKIEDISALLEKTLNDFMLEKSLQHNAKQQYVSIAEIRKSFANYLAEESSSYEHFFAKTDKSLSLANLCIALFKMGTNNSIDIPQYVVESICDETMKGEGINGIAFQWENGNFVLMYNCTDAISEDQHEEYLKLLSLLDKRLEKYLGIPISHSINIICKKNDNLRQKFSEAINIMDYCYYYAISSSLFKVSEEQHSGRKELVHSIQKALDVNNYTQAVSILKEYVSRMHSALLRPEKVKTSVVAAMNVFLTHPAILDSQNSFTESLEAYLTETANASTAAIIENIVEQFCKSYLEQVSLVTHRISPAIKLALGYINEHYNQKITLDDVAAHVFLNRSYLSQLFKKEMGVAFADYLETVRINHAKRLISNSNKSMSEIAEYVGFSNQNYFTKVFKKVTGVSPLQYKKNNDINFRIC